MIEFFIGTNIPNKKGIKMNKVLGKVAVVTGGNSGIGYAAAKDLLANGAKVIITGRDEQRVNDAAKELGVKGIVSDVRDLKSIDALVSLVEAEVGKIDILFVNAGIFTPEAVGSISEGVYDDLMDINFKGAVFTVEKFIPILNDGASVINLSSINAYTGMPNTAIYGASKAAMNSYTRTAATELAPRKIRVNAINPGPTQTPIFGKTGLAEADLNALAGAMMNRIPLKRFGQVEDIAHLVTFLASDNASFITGSEINIDGGMNINPLLS